MKYGLLVYKDIKNTFNVGDYIQSLAAKQFLPTVDLLLNREDLAHYSGPTIKLILNGWFTHDVENWAPSGDVNPLFISFHLNGRVADRFLSIKRNHDYLKEHEPIGCRDFSTMRVLKKNNIECYFTGCLTLTLGETYRLDNFESNKVICADVAFDTPSFIDCFGSMSDFYWKGLRKRGLFNFQSSKSILDMILNCSHEKYFLDHIIKSNACPSHEERLMLAQMYLKEILKSRLVITSRIHSALPAAGIGVANIFVHSGFEDIMDSSRFEGLIDFLNVLDLNSKKSLVSHQLNHISDTSKFISKLPLETSNLIKTVKEFINE